MTTHHTSAQGAFHLEVFTLFRPICSDLLHHWQVPVGSCWSAAPSAGSCWCLLGVPVPSAFRIECYEVEGSGNFQGVQPSFSVTEAQSSHQTCGVVRLVLEEEK